MAKINLEAVASQLERIKNPSYGRKERRPSRWWYPKQHDVKYTVRLVCWPDNDGVPVVTRKAYRNINDWKPILAPYQFQQPDPVQDVIENLQAARSGASEAEVEEYNRLLKGLYPKDVYYVLLLDRDNPDDGLKMWSVSKTIVTEIYNTILDDDYGDITDPHNGIDLTVIRSSVGGKTTTSIKPARNNSPLVGTQEEFDELLADYPHPDKLEKRWPEDELRELVDAWVSNGGQHDPNAQVTRSSARTESADEEAPAAKPAKASKTSKIEGAMSSIDAAFANA